MDLVADIYDIESWKHHIGNNKLQLIVADPPYGNIVKQKWDNQPDAKLADDLVQWCKRLEPLCHEGAALYMWGGYGTPNNRAFYRFILGLEEQTNWRMSAHLTWHKKRAYGVQTNYLSTREEIAYCVLGNIKKPRVFNVPLLEKERGYEGYNEKYKAKSKYLRRTMVWNDITEIFKGKVHLCEKPKALSKVMVETSSNSGDLVLDAFAGSRNCARVAEELGREVISIEKDTTCERPISD